MKRHEGPAALARAAIRLFIVVAGLAFATTAQAQCSRATLQKLADTYVKAQTAGNAGLVPLAKGASYAENNKAMDIGQGVLAGPLKVDFTRSFLDTAQCASFTELVAASDPHPYVIHTRIEATKGGKVTNMETVVTDAGDWMFGAAEHLAVTRDEKWDKIPASNRDTRAVIQAAADAYLDNWGDPELPVPHGTPCYRLEGRINTGSKKPQDNTCDMGAFPQKLKVGHRRYVIDETIGAVSIFHDFPGSMRAATRSGDPGQPDVSGRGRKEPLHPRGDRVHDAAMWEGEVGA